MINKIKFELDDDELNELKELINKLKQARGEMTTKVNGTLRGAANQMQREINNYEDLKKRDLW